MTRFLCLAVAVVLIPAAVLRACAQKPAAAPDVLVFTNGDQLTGHFVRAEGGSVIFKSDMAGELTVSLDKVKELRSSSDFVALRKSEKKQPVTTTGAVRVEAGNVVITPANAPEETIASKDLAFLIDQSTYNKEVASQPGFLHAWTGTVTAGASLVRSTQNATTFTGGAALVRAIPTVPYLAPRNRTSVDVIETYGKQTSPVIPPTTPATTVVVQTSIFHADAERDQYLSSKFFALADASFDHNYAQGLQLQQIYGAGVGYTAFKTARQELDFKGDAHYEKQRYFSVTPGVAAAPSVNVFGSTFTESYLRNLPRKMVFTEVGNYLAGWTDLDVYSANVSATLALPVYKRFSASFNVTDNYLNDPAPFYKKNSFQFTSGVTYTLP